MKKKIGLLLAWVFYILGIAGVATWLMLPNETPPNPEDIVAIDFPEIVQPSAKQASYSLDAPENDIRTADTPPIWEAHVAPEPKKSVAAKPKVAIVLTNLGRDAAVFDYAMKHLPEVKTLAFLPSTEDLDEISTSMKSEEKEILITLAMEPRYYPRHDPGPNTLLTDLKDEENLERFKDVIRERKGFMGFTNLMGGAFLSRKKNLLPIFQEIKRQGYVFLEGKSTFRSLAENVSSELGVPYLRGHFIFDEDDFLHETENPFKRVETFAKRNGIAIVVLAGTMPNLKRVKLWADSLIRKDIHIVPLSYVYKNPDGFPKEVQKAQKKDIIETGDEVSLADADAIAASSEKDAS